MKLFGRKKKSSEEAIPEVVAETVEPVETAAVPMAPVFRPVVPSTRPAMRAVRPAVVMPTAAIVDTRPAAMHAARLHEGGVPVVEPAVAAATVPAASEVAPVIEPVSGVAPKPSKPGSRIGGKVAWFSAMSMIGVAVGLVIVAGMKFIDGPVEGTPKVSLAQKQVLAASNAAPQPSELAGLYIYLMYPGIFDKVGRMPGDAQGLEQYNIASTSDYSRTIAVSVRNLPGGKLDEDSGYRFRQIKTDEYTEKAVKVGAEPAAIMSKIDKSEQTLFWAHKTYVVTVSITSNNPKDDLVAYMEQARSTLRWRQ